MADHIVKFPVRVSIISPVHIGSGEIIDPKWFTWDGSRVTLLDEEKLLRQVIERNQVYEFEQFCGKPYEKAGDFLDKARIPTPGVAAYTLACPERPREIRPFIKTTGRPYLPGSSLKGALRSSLLRAFFLTDAAARASAAERLEQALQGRPDRTPGLTLETLLFTGTKAERKQTQNFDLLRLLGLSDSARLQTKILEVRPVQILSAQTDHTLEPKNFTLFPELMMPGYSFKVQMTLDLSLLLKNYGQDYLGVQGRSDWVLNFATHCRAAAKNILEQDAAFYESHRRPRLADWCGQRLAELKQMGQNECLLPIGWGSGYDAKTVTDLFSPDLFETTLDSYYNTKRLGRPSGRGEWLGPDLSPKTRRVTEINGEETPLGWLKLSA